MVNNICTDLYKTTFIIYLHEQKERQGIQFDQEIPFYQDLK